MTRFPTRLLASVLVAPALLSLACTPGPPPEESALRVAVVRYQHETCTFWPGGDTDVEAWTRIRDAPDYRFLPLERLYPFGAGSRPEDGAGGCNRGTAPDPAPNRG